jgi:hypothetical protein
MNDERFPLPPDVVARQRAREAPSPEVRARVRARLAAVVPAMGGPRGGDGSGGSPAPGSGGKSGVAGTAGLGSRVVATLTAFVIGGGVGVAVYASLSKPPAPAVVYVDRPLLLPSPSSVPASAPVPAMPAAPAPVELTNAGTTRPSFAAAAAAPAAQPLSQLEAERAMLDDARTALLHGEPTRSLEHLARHRRAFASPRLGEERDAMFVEALVKAGRYSEARAQAEAFHRTWPGSLFAATVDSAAESIP